MFGRNGWFAVAVMAGSLWIAEARAQDGGAQQQQRRPSSLSERLQQFREDLFGENPNGPRPEQRPMPRPNAAQRQERGPTPVGPTAAAPPTAAPQLKVQSARRAQPGAGAPDVDDEDDEETESDRPSPSSRQAVAEDDEEGEEKPQPRLASRTASVTKAKLEKDVEKESATRERLNVRAASGVLFTAESPVLFVEATGPRKILIGKEAQFVVKIRNAGATANNVVVSVAIPEYAEVVSTQATAGSAQSPVAGDRREPLEWKLERLEAKANATLTLKLIPRKSTPFDLAVQWTFTPEGTQTLVEVQEPKLVMSIAGPEEVLYGQSKVYKLTVSNPGNGDSENVSVGLLPLGHAAEGSASHRLGTLKSGESRNIDIELTARQAGVIAIKAQAFADGGLRAEAVQQVMVRRASLRIDVEAPKVKFAGTVGTFHVKVINAGNATADNVQVSAILPPDAKHVSSNGGGRLEPQQGKINWNIGTLQPGGQRIFETQCLLAAPGDNRMQFVAMAEGDLSAAITTSTRVDALADLKLEVKDPQGPVAVGEDTFYEVHIRNRGTKAAENIEAAVFFSEGLEAVGVEGGAHEITQGQVVFKPIVVLGANDTLIYRVRARADRVGNHRFRAEVVCQSLNTRLAAEEATRFYGEEKSGGETARESEPLPTAPQGSSSEPQPSPAGEVTPLPQPE